MIYYATILVLSLFSILNQFKVRKTDLKSFIYISIIAILIIGGLRFEVGTDWFSYKNIFNSVSLISELTSFRVEKGFLLFVFIIKNIINDYSFFVFIFFLATFSVKLVIIKKYSTDIFISLMIYFSMVFLLYDINGIRQGMAIGIGLLSIPYILSRNLTRFILVIILAALFHTSALILLPFYWIANMEFSKKKLIILTIGVLLISIPLRSFILNNPLMQYLLTIDRLSQYDSYLKDSKMNSTVPLLSIAVLQRFVVFIFIMVNYEKLIANDKFKRLLLNGYVLSIIVFLLFSFSAEFAARLGFYYKSLEILIIPLIISSQARLSNRIILLFLFLVFSLLGVYRLLAIEGGNLIPFNFYTF